MGHRSHRGDRPANIHQPIAFEGAITMPLEIATSCSPSLRRIDEVELHAARRRELHEHELLSVRTAELGECDFGWTRRDAALDRRDQRQRRRLLLRMKSGLEFVECHPDHAPRCLDFKDSRKSFSEMRARLFLDASYY